MVHKLLRHRGDGERRSPTGAPGAVPSPASISSTPPPAAGGAPAVGRSSSKNIVAIIDEYEQMIEQTIKREQELLALIDKLDEEAGRLNAEAKDAKVRLNAREEEFARFRGEAEADQRRLRAELDVLRNAPQLARPGAGPGNPERRGSLLSQARSR